MSLKSKLNVCSPSPGCLQDVLHGKWMWVFVEKNIITNVVGWSVCWLCRVLEKREKQIMLGWSDKKRVAPGLFVVAA
jgi:hypothetical protein